MSRQTAPPMSRALLRQLLRKLLPSDPELEAFCLDGFPAVQGRFAAGMERLIKTNLLLEAVEPPGVYAQLVQHCGEARVAEVLQQLDSSPEISQGPEVDALRDQLEQLYRARGQRRQADQPTAELDQEIRQIKQRQRQKPQLREGEVLAERYRLEEVIGRGGFAKVWLAFDRETRSFVAVKVLHSEQSEDSSRVARFRRGAQQIKALHHPHLVRILDGPAEENGFHYFVMELVPRGDLHEAVLKKRIDRQQALRAVLQTGEALEYAHRLGLIHRDVKPQNILLDQGLGARLTDFDLVLAADSTGGTRTGAMGTFLYAAPEEQEDASRVDHRADVYSLGMTALFVLHGKPLQHGDVLRRVLFIDALDCPEGARELLRSATAVDRDDRPASVAEFCTRLRELFFPVQTERCSLPPLAEQESAAPPRSPETTETTAVTRPSATWTHRSQETLPSVIRWSAQASTIVLNVGERDIVSSQTPTASAELVPPKGRRLRLHYFLLGGALALGAGAIYGYVKEPPLSPDVEAAELLAEVELDLQNKRWSYAIDKTGRVLSAQGVSQARRDLAASLRKGAAAEAKNKQTYDRFADAAGTGKYDAALSAYRDLPDTSVYKPSARAEYDKVFSLFAEERLNLAADARAQGRCTDAQAHVQGVLTIDPKQAKALAARELPCGSTNSPVVATNDPGGSASKPRAEKKPRGVKTRVRPGPEPPADKKKPVKPEVSAAEADAALAAAQASFIHGHYEQAISQARRMTKANPFRAWQIIGAAACSLHDVKLANEAYRYLHKTGHDYMVIVCQREGLAIQDGQFRPTNGQCYEPACARFGP